MGRSSKFYFSLQIFTILISSLFSLEVDLECKVHKNEICTNNQVNITEKSTSIKLKADNSDTSLYRILLFKDAYVEFIPQKINESFQHLEVLKISNSSLKEIEKPDFEGLEKLKEVSFMDNLITRLSADVFELLTDLEILNLNKNKISSIPSKIFTKNTNLKVVSFDGNQIQTIHDETFKKLVKLQILYLSDNILEDLRGGTFDNCPELTKLFIQNNKLKYIPNDIFDKNEKLKFRMGNFVPNNCIDDYKKTNDVTNMNELKLAFSENCKPPNQDFINEMKKKIEDLETELHKANESLNSTKDELKAVNQKHEECERKLETKDSDISDIKKKLNEKIDNCQTNLNKKEDEVTSLDSELNDLKAKKKDLEDVNKNLAANSTDIQKQLEKQSESIKSLEKYNKIFKDDWLACKVQNDKLSDDAKKLGNKSEEHLKEIENLKSQLLKKDTTIVEMRKESLQSQREFEIMKFSFDHLFDELKHANQTIKELAVGKCDLAKEYLSSTQELTAKQFISSLTEPIPTSYFDIDCKFEFTDYKAGAMSISFYTCSVNGVKNLNCDTKLKNISENLKPTKVESIQLTSSYFIDFPALLTDKFKNLKFLKISNSGFGQFVENICELSNDFEYISIKSSFIGDSIKLDKCSALKDIQIENSDLMRISTENPIKSLTNLILRKNKIEKVTKEFFANFENIKNVQLSGNKITQLDGDIFDKNELLEYVNFSDNPIKVINGDILTKNPKLVNADFKNLECASKTVFGKKIDELRSILKENCTK